MEGNEEMKRNLLLAVWAGGLILLGLGSPGAKADEAGWREVVLLSGGKLPEGASLTDLFGPLPTDAELAQAGALTPEEFLARYQSADEATSKAMPMFMAARLRELGRRGALKPAAVEAVLGAEGDGVRGSEFFAVPAVSGAAYRALLSYIEYAAANVPGGAYQPSEPGRARIDRSLQAYLALAAADTRTQYADFDEIRTGALLRLACASPEDRAALLPGALWLYELLRDAAGLTWLPAPSPELSRLVEAEDGTFFMQARREADRMPESLAALTLWKCGE